MLGRSIDWGRRVAVVALTDDVLLGAALVALGLEEEVDSLVLAHVGPGAPWAARIASWYAERGRDVEVRPLGCGLSGFDRVVVAGSSLSTPIPDALRDAPGALFALVAAGVEADELGTIRKRLLELGALGALHVEHVARFGRAGREYIELVEHAHHLAGPAGQSRAADTLRAALFGKSGPTPVNLTSLDDPPHLDPLTTMVFYVDMAELQAS